METADEFKSKSVEQFNDNMDLPHQRPAYGVNAPALFRHIGFRIAGDQRDPLRATNWQEAQKYREDYIDQLNEVLGKIQKICGATEVFLFGRDKGGSATNKATWIDPRKTLLTVLNPPPDEGTQQDLSSWRVRLRVDIHTEYYYITLILDQKTDADNPVPPVAGSAKQARAYEKQLSDAAVDAAAPRPDSDEVKKIVDFFYEDVWNALDRRLLPLINELRGPRFTEFRSIALRSLPSLFSDMKSYLDHPRFIVEDKQGLKAARSALHKWVNANGDVVRGILKFNLLTREIDRDANCVLCEVLDGGAVYGSSLGQNTPVLSNEPKGADGQPREVAPLRYFIVYNDLSKYQLGRLIRLTNVLGELRMAAVFDIAQLSQASVRIQTLGNKITEITSRAASTPQATTLRESELKEIQKELYEIGSSGIPGGLAFRTARSRYYASAFKNRLKGMRVRRIEGWEPYDSFVRRKIYQVFSFLSEVGVRFETLANRLHRLVTVHNAQRLNLFQDNVGALVDKMTKTNEEVLDVQKDIWTIQVLGEAIGVTAFAYYGGHIIALIIGAIVKAHCSVTGESMPACKAIIDPYTEIIDLAAVFLALILLRPLWYLWRRHRSKAHSAPAGQSQSRPIPEPNNAAPSAPLL